MRIRPRPAAALLSLALLWGSSSPALTRKPEPSSGAAVPSSATATVELGTIVGTLFGYFNDTFPANETPGLPGTANFDTTSALIRSGLNLAPLTGDTLRFDIPGDSCVFSAPDAVVSPPGDPALAAVRADLVFRILPGPGNYKIAGATRNVRFSGGTPAGRHPVDGDLLQVSTNQGARAV